MATTMARAAATAATATTMATTTQPMQPLQREPYGFTVREAARANQMTLTPQ